MDKTDGSQTKGSAQSIVTLVKANETLVRQANAFDLQRLTEEQTGLAVSKNQARSALTKASNLVENFTFSSPAEAMQYYDEDDMTETDGIHFVFSTPLDALAALAEVREE